MAPVPADGEDPPAPLEVGFGLTEPGAGVGVGVDPGPRVEPDEPVVTGEGATEVDEDAPLIIVNSGLALPESPNTNMKLRIAYCVAVRTTYRRQYSLSEWERWVP